MANRVQPIVSGAARAIDFYERAFGAKEKMRLDHGGKIGHAEIRIGDSPIMLADEHPEMGARSPQTFGGSPVSILLVEDPFGHVWHIATRKEDLTLEEIRKRAP